MNSAERLLYGELEDELGYVYRDKDLLIQALTHSSYANFHNRAAGSPRLDHNSDSPEPSARIEDNERLEWLGDSLIGSAVSLKLYALYGAQSEAALTKARSAIVSRASLSRVGAKLRLEEYVLILDQRNASNLNILANTVEALIGAMYLDWIAAGNPRLATYELDGYTCTDPSRSDSPVDRFVDKFISLREPTGEAGEGTDWKSLLQEHLQAHKRGVPKYNTLNVSGPEHCAQFKV